MNGLIAPTTPIGSRSVNASLPSPAALASIGTTSPASVRAATAANVNVDTARCASTRAVLIGLAASLAMSRANSSTRSASRRAAVSRISARFHGGERSASTRAAFAARDRAVDLRRTALGDPAEERVVVRRADLDPLAVGERLAAEGNGPIAARS